MNNSLLTPDPLAVHGKTNFDGTKLPLVVICYQTTTNGMNLPFPYLLFPSPEASGTGGKVAFHARLAPSHATMLIGNRPHHPTGAAMPATSPIVEQLIDGPGFALLPNLIDASEAAQARSRILEVVASPSGSSFGKLNEKIGQQHLRGLLWHGEIFE